MAQSAYIIKKKRNRFVLFTTLIVSAALLFCAVYLHFVVNVNPVLKTIANEEIKSKTTVILNKALSSVMGENISYDDIVVIGKNADGKIDTMSINTLLVNNIARDATLIAQSELDKTGKTEISVPLGSLSGITFFGGLGPDVKITCIPTGAVSVSFKSVFQSVGINNTLHSVKMNFDTTVNIIIPGLKDSVTVRTEVLIADSIIVGDVPDTYLHSAALDEMLNLIP